MRFSKNFASYKSLKMNKFRHMFPIWCRTLMMLRCFDEPKRRCYKIVKIARSNFVVKFRHIHVSHLVLMMLLDIWWTEDQYCTADKILCH